MLSVSSNMTILFAIDCMRMQLSKGAGLFSEDAHLSLPLKFYHPLLISASNYKTMSVAMVDSECVDKLVRPVFFGNGLSQNSKCLNI